MEAMPDARMIAMKTRLLISALVIASLAAAVQAQTTTKKLYRWVDKEGKVHFDDALPPEAVDQARDEFNASSGSKVGTLSRALTPEERAKQAADQAAAATAAAAASEQERKEKVMLASYETEADLVRAYNERIGLLKSTMQSTDVSIKSMRDTLADLLANASESELAHRKVFGKRATQIAELHSELVKQETFQINRRGEYAALNEEFKRMLARYRELRAAAPAGTATAPAAADATPTTTP
jgi:vacuolar-type H+-ATPase subunit I/STV1